MEMILFESDRTDAAFYLAAEEYIMRDIKPEVPALILWIIDDTVVIGANQVVKAEVDEAYAAGAGIAIARRPSGGGAIFADKGGIQFTVILPYDEGGINPDPGAHMREWLAEPLIETIGGFGVKASLVGRNDVSIDGKKVSGLSQFVKYGYICSHGTLIFSTDMEKLARVLTVDSEKIASKAVASVRKRVTSISEHIPVKDVRVFREALIESYGKNEAVSRRGFTADELARIEKIRLGKYGSPEWIYGHEPAFTYTSGKRFPGGRIDAFLDVKGGVIQNAVIRGDFLALKPVAEIEEGLAGVPHREEALREALRGLGVKSVLGSLTEDELLEVLV